MTGRSLGREGVSWFIGTVEDRDDPKKLGRIRVRVLNYHTTNKSLMPTEELPWAPVLMSVNSSSYQQIGIAPTGIQKGVTVIGMFLDGNDANQPIILGTLHGIPGNTINNHDVTLLARETNSIEKEYDSYEPSSAYASKYPFNKVLTTERGHVIEIDDTPGAERIHVYHKSGTYTEINKDGRQVDKVVSDHFEIILGNDTIHILGNSTVKIDGNADITVDGNVDLTVGGNFNAQVSGTYTVNSGGNMTFTAPKIDLN